MNDFQVFYPDRMASKILGMGDVLSLIEKAQQAIDKDEAKQLGERMLNKEFNLQDFLDIMQQTKKLGPISKLIEMMPGIPGIDTKTLSGVDISKGEKELKVKESIIRSMTLEERRNPSIISGSSSRKKRIAAGSGTSIQQVNRLLKDFDKIKKLMKQFNGMGNKKMFKKGMFGKLPF
jgi:signal recognition particle subunit SRP54